MREVVYRGLLNHKIAARSVSEVNVMSFLTMAKSKRCRTCLVHNSDGSKEFILVVGVSMGHGRMDQKFASSLSHSNVHVWVYVVCSK